MFPQYKKILNSAFAFLLLALGISLQIKAGIGQSMFNAFSMLLSNLIHIEIGTMINFLNLLFFIIYVFIKSSPLRLQDFIQIIATMVNGYVINLFTYTIFNHITIQYYYLKVFIFLLGLLLASISLGAILAMGMIRFPLENLCILLSEKLKCSLTRVRMCFDFFFFISTLTVTIINNQTLYIREGTIISFFLLSKLMGLSYEYCKKILKECN